jgi:hypothetical protein
MRKQITLLYFALGILNLTGLSVFAQISQPGTPWGLKEEKAGFINPLNWETMPQVNIDVLIEEDRVFDTIRAIPFRFGKNIDVNINTKNAGTWSYFNDGSKLWQLGIQSKGAVSLNFTFENYILPEGAKLFIYSPDGKHVIGAFTSLNNQDDGFFATTLLPGDKAIIEYYEPAKVHFKGEFNLFRVTHGYRGPGAFYNKGFGSSGSCNLNVACEASVGWEDQIRSVGMIVTGSNGFCSGALINNTENDATPYFLSADHCYKDASTVVFWFNWQSETCENPNTIPDHDAISGAVTLARNGASDFWLMELNQSLPDEYNVYFSGWNRTLEPTLAGTVSGIHHPSGDIKKFSWSEEGAQSADYLGSAGSGDTHWRVGPWSGETTTEPGSSGSPLFDPQGRIIGQLHGGHAACGNLEPDWYGRIGVSWTGGGSDATRLSTWLDPNNTDVEAIFGYDPILDAADPLAPAKIEDLEATAEENGALSVVLQWTNPSLTFEGAPLTQLDTIKIMRDGAVIHLIISPEIGEPLSFYDNTIEAAGNYTYTLRAINNAGDSPPANLTVYAGEDVPGKTSNIILVDQENNGYLTWEAPTEGFNGGFFQPASVTHYEILRNPDGATFTVDASSTELLDETLPGIGFYSYTIVAVNNIGPGGPASSDNVLLAAEGAIYMNSSTATTCEGTFFDSGGPGENYQNNENLSLTIFPETEGSKVNIRFTQFDTETNYDYLYVYNADKVSEEFLMGQFSGIGVPSELSNLTSSHPTGALTFVFTSDGSVTRMGWKADLSCFIPDDNDLAAETVSGNPTPTVGVESIYTVRVANTGFLTQTEYSVNLETITGETLSTIQGTRIEPGQVVDFQIPWTPSPDQEGYLVIKGNVKLIDDGNPGNNQTPDIEINVLPEGLQMVIIGTGVELPSFRIPFDFYWKNSLAQTIYFEDEVIIEEGTINGITFYNKFSSNPGSKPIRVYLQHTDLDALTGGFVPVTENELVFDGNIDFPAGENIIFIPIDVPFTYQGGNILLTTYREFEDQYFTNEDQFFVTTTPARPNRTIQFNSDSEVINPESPPASGSIVFRDAIANTGLFFRSSVEPPIYEVTFNVDMTNVPAIFFNPDEDQVFLAGSMTNWEEPGSNPDNQLMIQSGENPGFYTLTLELEAGDYSYKYFVNEGWEGEEWQGEPNRDLSIDTLLTINDVFAMGNWEFASAQFIHNSAGGTPFSIDIYANGRLVVPGLNFRHATEYLAMPASHEYTLSVVQAGADRTNSLITDTISFNPEDVEVFIISGLGAEEGFNPYQPLDFFTAEGRKQALNETHTDLLIFHGGTDMPGVSIWNNDKNTALATISFGEFSNHTELSTENYLIDMTDQNGQNLLDIYSIPLADLQLTGEALTMVASGFLHPENNNNGPGFGLWFTNQKGGELIELPVVTFTENPLLQIDDISVYPNPARDNITVSSSTPISHIILMDSKGSIVFQHKNSANELTLNTSHLNTGLYFLRVLSENGVKNFKLIIDREAKY